MYQRRPQFHWDGILSSNMILQCSNSKKYICLCLLRAGVKGDMPPHLTGVPFFSGTVKVCDFYLGRLQSWIVSQVEPFPLIRSVCGNDVDVPFIPF